jgi:hypothetical protein
MHHRAIGAALCVFIAAATPAHADWRRDNREACARLDERLKAIEMERRIGYTPKRGRRLQAEREKLTNERRERCR